MTTTQKNMQANIANLNIGELWVLKSAAHKMRAIAIERADRTDQDYADQWIAEVDFFLDRRRFLNADEDRRRFES